MEELIVAKKLIKSFNGNPVLDRASFSLNKEENLVLLGRSGAGKSVLLKMIVGLVDMDEGELHVFGKDISNLDQDEWITLRKMVGYLFQEGALYDSMTVRENVAFPLKRQARPKSKKEIENLVELYLDRVGLLESIDKMPNELSGGMKRRVALARTLILEPKIILYDEPTAGLDPVTSMEITRLILEMRDKYGISSIIATHDMLCVKMVADRIIILHEGKISAEGTYNHLKNVEQPWVKDFFSSYEER